MEIQTKVLTGLVRFSYANVFKPRKADGPDEKEKYSVCLLIPKSSLKTIAAINDAVAVAKEQGKNTKFEGKIPGGPNFKLPLRDGDLEKPGEVDYKGMYFVNCSNDIKPGLVDADRNEIIDERDFYSGCWGRATINMYPFNTRGNKGIAASLMNLQKLKDGEPLSGRASAEDDFAQPIEWDEEDLS